MRETRTPIEQVIADTRERANALRIEGHPVQAASVDRAVTEITHCLSEYLDILTESEAMLYTGRKADYLRARFAAWEARGLAMWDERGRGRRYRRCALEHRGNADAARAAGMRAAS